MGTSSQIGYLRDMIKCKLFFANNFERTGVCTASCERSYGGILENSFEHSEIRIVSNRQCPKYTKNAHTRTGVCPH